MKSSCVITLVAAILSVLVAVASSSSERRHYNSKRRYPNHQYHRCFYDVSPSASIDGYVKRYLVHSDRTPGFSIRRSGHRDLLCFDIRHCRQFDDSPIYLQVETDVYDSAKLIIKTTTDLTVTVSHRLLCNSGQDHQPKLSLIQPTTGVNAVVYVGSLVCQSPVDGINLTTNFISSSTLQPSQYGFEDDCYFHRIVYSPAPDSSDFSIDSDVVRPVCSSSDNFSSTRTITFNVDILVKCPPPSSSSSVTSASAAERSLVKAASFPLVLTFTTPPYRTDVVPGHRTRRSRRYRRALPVNHSPTFEESRYTEHVPEEQAAGYVVRAVTATDPDDGEAGRLTYSLVALKDGRSQAMFTVDELTGAVSTSQRLDRETMPVHHLKVVAKDAGRPVRTADTVLVVYVDDINDHAPRFESERYVKSVSESIGIGTTIQVCVMCY